MVTLLDDSSVKDIKPRKMNNKLGEHDRLYVKCFSGATVEDMLYYARPTIRKQPDLIILHAGTNELIKKKTANNIASDIVKLELELKTENNEVMVSSLICRNDDLHQKGKQVNIILKEECASYDILFIEHSNILKKHLNGSGIHLNYQGTVILANNFVAHIKV